MGILLWPKPQADGTLELDLSSLSGCLKRISYLRETPLSIRAAIGPDYWTSSVDLKDAYFHVLTLRTDRKWLCFVGRNHVSQFRARPFALSLAPLVFTKLVKELVVHFLKMDIHLHCYLDDWLVLADSHSKCAKHTSQSFKFLGIKFSLSVEVPSLFAFPSGPALCDG